MIDIFLSVTSSMHIDTLNINLLQNYSNKTERVWYTLVHIASRVGFYYNYSNNIAVVQNLACHVERSETSRICLLPSPCAGSFLPSG